MIKSMTGFSAKELAITSLGKVSVELRSINHKFLEIVLHLPDGFLSLEESIKKIIEAKVKRGRINCVITITGTQPSQIFINRPLLKNYLAVFTALKKQFQIQDGITLDTLIHLPGVLSLAQNTASAASRIWPHLKTLISAAVDDLIQARQKEGRATHGYLKKRAQGLEEEVERVKARFKRATAEKLRSIKSDEEKATFLRETDITEEIERLSFHNKNFIKKLSLNEPIGKELDFIAQEMQRETNTAGAKTADAAISAKVVQIRSQIEKIREQLQNVE